MLMASARFHRPTWCRQVREVVILTRPDGPPGGQLGLLFSNTPPLLTDWSAAPLSTERHEAIE